MRTARLIIATTCALALGITLPGAVQAASAAGGASAQVNFCDGTRDANRDDGYFRAYDAIHCQPDVDGQSLGMTQGDDANWGNSLGAFRGPDSNKATSLINTGTYSNGWNVVKVYSGTGYSGGHLCLGRNDYIDNLATDRNGNRQTMSNGSTAANNTISSHQWVTSSSCAKWGW
jgi:hypothetical protein